MMKLKKAIGIVFHKLLDRKTAVNPITQYFYPDCYKFTLDSCRRWNMDVFFISPMQCNISNNSIPKGTSIKFHYVINGKRIENN